MSSEKQDQLITYTCNKPHCDNTIEISSHSFKDAWESVKEKGWRAFKKDDEWQHACPACVRLFAEQQPSRS